MGLFAKKRSRLRCAAHKRGAARLSGAGGRPAWVAAPPTPPPGTPPAFIRLAVGNGVGRKSHQLLGVFRAAGDVCDDA